MTTCYMCAKEQTQFDQSDRWNRLMNKSYFIKEYLEKLTNKRIVILNKNTGKRVESDDVRDWFNRITGIWTDSHLHSRILRMNK